MNIKKLFKLTSTSETHLSKTASITRFLATLFFGVLFITLTSQIVIPLPWTPVPITGQTFGVILMAVTLGAFSSTSVMLSYFGLGLFGLPIMAAGKSLLLVGPTTGYIVGMIFAAYLVGRLKDSGFAKSFSSVFLISFISGLLILAFGAFGLSFFIPKEAVMTAGVYPFLFGDFVKSIAVAAIYSATHRQGTNEHRL